MSEDEGTIPNPYKAAVKAAKAEVAPHAHTFQGMLARATTAMEAGAWISSGPAAETFGNGLAEQKTKLDSVPEGVSDAFDAILKREPDDVAPHSWQTRWHNL